MIALVESQRERIAELCRSLGVQRLDLFGSGVRDDYSPSSSDLDFLVEFNDRPPAKYAEAWLTLQEELELLLGRPIDLVTSSAMANPYFRDRVLQTRETIYAR
ncbi:nucleotidyltransferase domain-containing protein [Azoarcus sp. PA01]|nr:nucleotidyltransferase domain-containing protein [Azoarcus sp. PA01]